MEGKLESLTPTQKYKYIFEKGDVYSLGRTLSQIFYDRFGMRDEGMSEPHIQTDFNPLKLKATQSVRFANDVATPYYLLVRGMMNPDIRARLTIKQAAKMYNTKVLPAMKDFFKAMD